MPICTKCQQGGLKPYFFGTKGAKTNHQRICPFRGIPLDEIIKDPEVEEQDDEGRKKVEHSLNIHE